MSAQNPQVEMQIETSDKGGLTTDSLWTSSTKFMIYSIHLSLRIQVHQRFVLTALPDEGIRRRSSILFSRGAI
jgi:hypothetical protein